jgi:PKD repeat protein
MVKFYNLNNLTKVIATTLVMILFNNVNAFQGGNYTIDKNGTASATNYLSFTALANDLKNINRGDGGPNQYAVGGAGVQGPVRIDVLAGSGPYNERFQLTQIMGVSASRPVYINGNGNVIQYANTAFGQGVIEMNGTDYFTFYDLEVRSTSQNQATGARCFWLYRGADFNNIIKCKMRTTLSHDRFDWGSAYLYISNSTGQYPQTYENAGNDNLIDSCDMSSPGNTAWGPFMGIVLDGPDSRSDGQATNRNTISNSNIQNFNTYGIYSAYSGGITLFNNTFHNTGSTQTRTYGVVYGLGLELSDFIVEGNRVYNLAGSTPTQCDQYPLYVYQYWWDGFVNQISEIKNNVFHSFSSSKCWIENSVYWDSYYSGYELYIENNTFSNSHPTVTDADGYATMLSGFGWTNLTNNIFNDDIQGQGGDRYLLQEFNCMGYDGSYGLHYMENNNFRFGPRTTQSGGLNKVYSAYNQTCRGDATFQDMLNNGLPTSNVSIDPMFVDNTSNSIMIPTSAQMSNKGMELKSVPVDILGEARSSTPDIGAYEYFVDLEMVRMTVNLPNPTCAGHISSLGGTIRNNSSVKIPNPSVQYILNGATPITYNVPATINPGDSINFTFPVPVSFTQSGSNDLTVRFQYSDDNPVDDELSINFNVGTAPGGSVITKDNVLSSQFAKFSISNARELTFPFETLAYDVSAPSRVGYTNAEWDTDWTAQVTATTTTGKVADSLFSIIDPTMSDNMKIVFNASKLWENDTINFVLRILNNIGGCDTNFRRSIIIAPKAVPNFTTPTPVCANSTFLFNNVTTVSSGGVSVEWDLGDGTTSTDYSVGHTYTQLGNYTVTLKTTTIPHGFVTQITKNISVQEMPVTDFNVDNACEGQNVIFKNNSSYTTSGTASYTWEFGDNTFVIVNNKNNYPKQYNAPGEYKVRLSTNLNGCISNLTKSAFQFAKPVASFVKTFGECLNDNYSFTNQSTISQGQVGSEWFFDDLGNRSTNTSPTYKFASSGNKNVKLIAISEFGCKDSMTRQITVKQTATTGFTFPFACSSTPTPFTNTTNLNGQVLSSNPYMWNFGDGSTSTAFAPIKSWGNIGTRVVSLTTNLANGCSTTETKTIVVGTQPSVRFFFNDQCAGSPVAFSNATTAPQGQLTYQWSFGDGNTSTLPVPTHLYNTTTAQTFTVKLKATVGSGCSDSLSKTINISPAPTSCDFDIVGNTNAGSSVPLTFTPKDGSLSGITYTWLMGDGSLKTSVGAGTTYQYTSAGKYCITMTAKNAAGCECSKTNCTSLSTNINNAESMNNAVSIYPNPNSGVFNVTLDSKVEGVMSVSVFNTIGELISTIEVLENTAIINLTDVASGVYTVKVTSGNQIATKKITIVR